MIRAILLVNLALVMGCNSLPSASKVKNPVAGPPPPRVSTIPRRDNEEYARKSRQDAAETSGIAMTSLVGPGDTDESADIPDTAIVATVNGSPLFASEVLAPYQHQLSAARPKIPPEEYVKIRKSLIRRNLASHLEHKLLVESMKEMLEPEQLTMLNEQLDEIFEKEDVPRFLKQNKLATKPELEIKLQKQGESLDAVKRQLSNQRLAMEYLRAKTNVVRDVTRQDLLGYYQAHQEEYAVASKVRWQQISVSFSKHDGKREALSALNRAVEELRNQVDFAEVARRHSDGPTAASGGAWDWTVTGSLADQTVEKSLFELPVGQISQVIEGESSFQLVRVLDRQDAGHLSFEKVQDEIRSTLMQQRREESTQPVLREILDTAVIWTIFDGQDEVRPKL